MKSESFKFRVDLILQKHLIFKRLEKRIKKANLNLFYLNNMANYLQIKHNFLKIKTKKLKEKGMTSMWISFIYAIIWFSLF